MIGGLTSHPKHVAGIRDALLDGRYHSDAYAVTFSFAVRNWSALHEVSAGCELYMHLAAPITMVGARALQRHVIAPPILGPHRTPHNVGELAASAVQKTDLLRQEAKDDPEKMRKFIWFTSGCVLEGMRHPLRNGVPVITNRIGQFDAIDDAANHNRWGIPTTVAVQSKEGFFPYHDEARERAEAAGVVVIELEGHHDEVVLNPVQVIRSYHEQRVSV